MSNIFSGIARKAVVLSAVLAAAGLQSASVLANEPASQSSAFNAGAAARLQNDLRINPARVNCGVQFTGTIPGNSTQLWFTFNWPAASYIDWQVMSDTVYSGGSEVTLSNVATQRADATHATYWLTVVNNSSATQNFEGRYCILR